jgi:hypothetical protein
MCFVPLRMTIPPDSAYAESQFSIALPGKENPSTPLLVTPLRMMRQPPTESLVLHYLDRKTQVRP